MQIAQITLPNEVPNVTNSPQGGFLIDDPLKNPANTPLGKFGSVGEIITSIVPYLMIMGGLILFVMLIMGGFEMLTSVGNQEKTAAAAARIKNALIGFLLLFAVFWLAQIIQVLFRIQIL